MFLKDTHRENTPSNETEALTKSMFGLLNSIKFSKKLNSQWQKFILCDGPFCTPHSICLNIWFQTGQFCMEMLRFHS